MSEICVKCVEFNIAAGPSFGRVPCHTSQTSRTFENLELPQSRSVIQCRDSLRSPHSRFIERCGDDSLR
jgi:hypothetical protein